MSRFRSTSVFQNRWAAGISGLGGLFGAVLLIEGIIAASTTLTLPDGYFIGVVTSLPVIVGLLYAGTWLHRTDIPAARVPRIAAWCVGGVVVTSLLILLLTLSVLQVTVLLVIGTVRWAGSIGGGIGFVIGLIEAQKFELSRMTGNLKDQREDLQRERDRLNRFADIVSDDLRKQLNLAVGNLELIREEYESDRLEKVTSALRRIDAIIEGSLLIARHGRNVEETEQIDVSDLAKAAWTSVETDDASLEIEDTLSFEADRDRLRIVFENLLQNAVEHGGADVTVRVGDLSNGDGFYIEDTGPGIDASERERVFENGYSTSTNRAGLGLSIVEELVIAHEWDITLTESDNGGTRIEIYL